MILVRASVSTLRGMNVANASRAMSESIALSGNRFHWCSRENERTLLADAEQLVSLPSDDPTCQPAPAPLDDAAQDLRCFSFCPSAVSCRPAHHRLRQNQLLGEAVSLHAILFLEKVPDECSRGARIGGRAEGEKEEGEIEGYGRCSRQQLSRILPGRPLTALGRTSCLEFAGACAE